MPKKCARCGEPLDRIFYKIAFIRGNYCKQCAYDMYRQLGLKYYLVDQDDQTIELVKTGKDDEED